MLPAIYSKWLKEKHVHLKEFLKMNHIDTARIE